jgi:predicted amidohydrolase
MQIGYLQTQPVFGDVKRNLEHIKFLLDQRKADLWVLPEFFATGYQFASEEEVRSLSEPIPTGPTTEALITLASDHACHIVAGLPERDRNTVYNAAVLVGSEGVLARYHKIHLFSEEKRWFAPGNLPFPVVDIGSAKVGMMICFDHFFPESARTLTLKGAEILAHPSNLVMPVYAQLTMRTRALENGVFTVTANRVGTESRVPGKTLRYTGESQIVSPQGEILAHSPARGEDIQVVTIDPADARNKALNPLNNRIADRRPDYYYH